MNTTYNACNQHTSSFAVYLSSDNCFIRSDNVRTSWNRSADHDFDIDDAVTCLRAPSSVAGVFFAEEGGAGGRRVSRSVDVDVNEEDEDGI